MGPPLWRVSRARVVVLGSLAAGALSGAVACGTGAGAPPGSTASTSADAAALGAGVDAAVACSVDAPTSCPTPLPTYADVAPVFASRCASCHSGAAGGPWPLDSYTNVRDWQDQIRTSLVECTMPPPDAGAPIPDAERRAILTWMKCGAPP